MLWLVIFGLSYLLFAFKKSSLTELRAEYSALGLSLSQLRAGQHKLQGLRNLLMQAIKDRQDQRGESPLRDLQIYREDLAGRLHFLRKKNQAMHKLCLHMLLTSALALLLAQFLRLLDPEAHGAWHPLQGLALALSHSLGLFLWGRLLGKNWQDREPMVWEAWVLSLIAHELPQAIPSLAEELKAFEEKSWQGGLDLAQMRWDLHEEYAAQARTLALNRLESTIGLAVIPELLSGSFSFALILGPQLL